MSKIYINATTKIFFLIAISLFVFSCNDVRKEIVILSLICFIAVLIGVYKVAIEGLISYLVLNIVKYIVLPALPNMVATNFNILIVTFIKLLPCFLVGKTLIRTTTIRELIFSLKKLHIPMTFIIPLSISIRYFPTLIEEWHSISDAMKIRNIKGLSRFKFAYIPLMISASNTADELSQAIIARGIENPNRICYVVTVNNVFDKMLALISFGIAIYSVFNLFGGSVI